MLAGALLSGCAATPDDPGHVDALTVSGRFGLPVAAASGPRFRMDSVVVAPEAAKAIGVDGIALAAEAAQAAARSLANHGWSTHGAGEGATIMLMVRNAEVVSSPEGLKVALALDFAAGAPCATTSLTSSFVALKRRDDNGDQRAIAVLATAAMAAAGVNGGQFLIEQLNLADADADADGRNLRLEEGRATPPRTERPSAFAARRAFRNGLALYIAHLARSCDAQPSP